MNFLKAFLGIILLSTVCIYLIKQENKINLRWGGTFLIPDGMESDSKTSFFNSSKKLMIQTNYVQNDFYYFYIFNEKQRGSEKHQIEQFMNKIELKVTPLFNISQHLSDPNLQKYCGYCFFYSVYKMIEISAFQSQEQLTVSSNHLENDINFKALSYFQQTCLHDVISKIFTCDGGYSHKLMLSLNELFQLKNKNSKNDEIIKFVTSSNYFNTLKEMIFTDYANPYFQGQNSFKSNLNLQAPFLITMCLDEMVVLNQGQQDFYTCQNPEMYSQQYFKTLINNNFDTQRHLKGCYKKHAAIFLRTEKYKYSDQNSTLYTMVFWHQWKKDENSQQDGSEFRIIFDYNKTILDPTNYYPCRLGAGVAYSVNFRKLEKEDNYTRIRQFFDNQLNQDKCYNNSQSQNVFARIDLYGNFTVGIQESLEQKEIIHSENKKFYLKLQEDGDLVSFKANLEGLESQNYQIQDPENALFCTQTSNISMNKPFRLKMNFNGLLEIVDKNKEQIWNSSTFNYNSNKFTKIFIDNNGKSVIQAQQWEQKPLWIDGRFSVLFKQNFNHEDALYSPNQNFKLTLDVKGCLNLIERSGNNFENEYQIWTSLSSKGQFPFTLRTIDKKVYIQNSTLGERYIHKYQLQIQDSLNIIIWESQEYESKYIQRLHLTDKGQLQIEDFYCNVIGFINNNNKFQFEKQSVLLKKKEYDMKIKEILLKSNDEQEETNETIGDEKDKKVLLQQNNEQKRKLYLEKILLEYIITKTFNNHVGEDIQKILGKNEQNQFQHQELKSLFSDEEIFFRIISQLLNITQGFMDDPYNKNDEAIIKIAKTITYFLKNLHFENQNINPQNFLVQFDKVFSFLKSNLGEIQQDLEQQIINLQQNLSDDSEDLFDQSLLEQPIHEKIQEIMILTQELNLINKTQTEGQQTAFKKKHKSEQTQQTEQLLTSEEVFNINQISEIQAFSHDMGDSCNSVKSKNELTIVISGNQDVNISEFRQLRIEALQKQLFIFSPLNEKLVDKLTIIINLVQCNEQSLTTLLNYLPFHNEEIYLILNCELIRSEAFHERYDITEARIVQNIYNSRNDKVLYNNKKAIKFLRFNVISNWQQVRSPYWNFYFQKNDINPEDRLDFIFPTSKFCYFYDKNNRYLQLKGTMCQLLQRISVNDIQNFADNILFTSPFADLRYNIQDDILQYKINQEDNYQTSKDFLKQYDSAKGQCAYSNAYILNVTINAGPRQQLQISPLISKMFNCHPNLEVLEVHIIMDPNPDTIDIDLKHIFYAIQLGAKLHMLTIRMDYLPNYMLSVIDINFNMAFIKNIEFIQILENNIDKFHKYKGFDPISKEGLSYDNLNHQTPPPRLSLPEEYIIKRYSINNDTQEVEDFYKKLILKPNQFLMNTYIKESVNTKFINFGQFQTHFFQLATLDNDCFKRLFNVNVKSRNNYLLDHLDRVFSYNIPILKSCQITIVQLMIPPYVTTTSQSTNLVFTDKFSQSPSFKDIKEEITCNQQYGGDGSRQNCKWKLQFNKIFQITNQYLVYANGINDNENYQRLFNCQSDLG